MAAQAHQGHEEHKLRVGANLRGAVVMIVGSMTLVGLAFGAMVLFTSPDGWLTKAANNTTGEAQVASEEVQ